MELLNLIADFVQGKTPGIFRLLNDIHEKVFGEIADLLLIDVAVLFVLGIIGAILCGVFAYRFAKLFLALIAADFGFFVGAQIYFSVQTETMPDWLNLVFGVVLAAIFFWLAYGRASYVWYVIVALLGYCATRVYFVDNLWVALGGAFVLAMLSIAFFRIVYILLTGFGSGVLGVSFLSALLPGVDFLRLEPRNYGFWGTVLIVSAIFILAQFWINCRCKRRRRA